MPAGVVVVVTVEVVVGIPNSPPVITPVEVTSPVGEPVIGVNVGVKTVVGVKPGVKTVVGVTEGVGNIVGGVGTPLNVGVPGIEIVVAGAAVTTVVGTGGETVTTLVFN